MFVRNHDGVLLEIKRENFTTDRDFYKVLLAIKQNTCISTFHAPCTKTTSKNNINKDKKLLDSTLGFKALGTLL